MVQHGEKVRSPGDPGLTELGRHQAEQVAAWLRDRVAVAAVWASPMRRARETAEPIAEALGQSVQVEPRLRERMSWEDESTHSLAEFLAEWDRASRDRRYRPVVGDSSAEAADRFLAAVRDLAAGAPADAVVVAVAHGGVTVDGLRTLLGDDVLVARRPELVHEGVPCGAVTRLRVIGDGVLVVSLPSTSHLAAT